MSYFSYYRNFLYVEQIPLSILATKFGTPLYVYSHATLCANFASYIDSCKRFGRAIQGPDATLICYSVKSNSNLAVLNLLHRLGSGFDIVSGGELLRVIAAGGDPHKVIFSGVGKGRDEMRLALSHNILCFNVESISELYRLNEVAGEIGKRARVSLRVNPNVDAKTHAYISTGLKQNKFGVAYTNVLDFYRIAATLTYIEIVGIDCHIGSQLLDDAPLLEALDKIIELIDILEIHNISIHHLDIGGGIGITYQSERPIAISDYLNHFFTRIDTWRKKQYNGKPIQIIFEPGRSIVGNAGVLITEVQYLKYGEIKNFAIIDAAMNDLMRPTLYGAWHDVQEVVRSDDTITKKKYDIVGPICESGDWLARDRMLAIAPGDLLAFMSTGAYGMSMASNYNTRGRAAEVMVNKDHYHLIRRRENLTDLFQLESIINYV